MRLEPALQQRCRRGTTAYAAKKSFNRKADLAVHAFKVHGRVREVRHYVSGLQCEYCLKHYAHTTDLLNLPIVLELSSRTRGHSEP